jgi:hypothetical protein
MIKVTGWHSGLMTVLICGPWTIFCQANYLFSMIKLTGWRSALMTVLKAIPTWDQDNGLFTIVIVIKEFILCFKVLLYRNGIYALTKSWWHISELLTFLRSIKLSITIFAYNNMEFEKWKSHYQ